MNKDIKELTDFLDTYDVDYEVVGDSVVADEVHLCTRGITQLPDSIGRLQCESLYLQCNNLTSLPDSIGKLKCEKLDLRYNILTFLSDSIGKLKCKELNLSDNKLTSESKQLLQIMKSAGVNVVH